MCHRIPFYIYFKTVSPYFTAFWKGTGNICADEWNFLVAGWWPIVSTVSWCSLARLNPTVASYPDPLTESSRYTRLCSQKIIQPYRFQKPSNIIKYRSKLDKNEARDKYWKWNVRLPQKPEARDMMFFSSKNLVKVRICVSDRVWSFTRFYCCFSPSLNRLADLKCQNIKVADLDPYGSALILDSASGSLSALEGIAVYGSSLKSKFWSFRGSKWSRGGP
jgi:hypothetical protein